MCLDVIKSRKEKKEYTYPSFYICVNFGIYFRAAGLLGNVKKIYPGRRQRTSIMLPK